MPRGTPGIAPMPMSAAMSWAIASRAADIDAAEDGQFPLGRSVMPVRGRS